VVVVMMIRVKVITCVGNHIGAVASSSSSSSSLYHVGHHSIMSIITDHSVIVPQKAPSHMGGCVGDVVRR